IAYATVHNDEQTPHMHLGVVPMRDGKLQGKNVFNRQELLWLQDKFPEHMQKQGFELERGEKGYNREHIETIKFKKQTLKKERKMKKKKKRNSKIYEITRKKIKIKRKKKQWKNRKNGCRYRC